MASEKNPIIAFLLAFIPGGGLMYLGKVLRGIILFMVILGTIPAAFIISDFMMSPWPAILLIGMAFLAYLVSIVYTALLASRGLKDREKPVTQDDTLSRERFYSIILSMIPGLGHFQLGLMNRGVTFLATFLGVAAMILFVTAMTGRGEFMVFLIVLPVIWVYNFFDTMQLLNKKQAGEVLTDRSVLEDLEAQHEGGRKSKAFATFLSMFPGAGHLYLGFQRRGIQLMAAFLFSIYILDVLRLGIFLFLVPIIWFYSFFDGLQRASKHGKEPQEDTPIVSYLINQQKWVGIGLMVLGVYYLAVNILLPLSYPLLDVYGIDPYHVMNSYIQPGIVCLLLIGGGIKLIAGSKRANSEREVSE
ncbi:hypothetical protein [Bacillus sp. KH172YL63]|uniref:hypothetical protein n=1 Tax=Bacillus sp. KH172YL63 TaxID=2709784 RepID=UPI0013E423CE|nr:hypothetical protein [Bacillus sp. KH172YL63]BCB02650.1 hypothetical protein KH172YL63_07830 [Bacillus sp. KH172YL63]